MMCKAILKEGVIVVSFFSIDEVGFKLLFETTTYSQKNLQPQHSTRWGGKLASKLGLRQVYSTIRGINIAFGYHGIKLVYGSQENLVGITSSTL